MLFIKICSSILISKKLPLPDEGKYKGLIKNIQYTQYPKNRGNWGFDASNIKIDS